MSVETPVDGLLQIEETDEVTYSLAGQLDQDGAPLLSDYFQPKVTPGAVVHLHMERVTFLSSAGVGSLISLIGAFRDEGGDVVLHGCSEELMHVFELLKLLDYITTG